MKLSPALRKAAILISSLDARSADALLDQMGEAQARRVRDAVLELGDIPPHEQEAVIAEFLGNDSPAATATFDDGVELAGSLATLPPLAKQQPAAASPPAAEPPRKPFSFLHDADCHTIARHLQREHPQTIAVVLAHLPPAKAASLVAHFSAELQAEVLERVATIEEMDSEVVREVEHGLEVVLAKELQRTRRRGSGVATLEAILNAAGEAREQLVQNVARRDQQLAEQVAPAVVRKAAAPLAPTMPRRRLETPESPAERLVKSNRQEAPITPPAIEFAQLAQLDDRAWARLLRAADVQVSLLALAGATPELVDRLLSQLPPGDARALQRKMEQLGAVRLRDIERAQEHLARIATQLAARGEIRLPRLRPFATAA